MNELLVDSCDWPALDRRDCDLDVDLGFYSAFEDGEEGEQMRTYNVTCTMTATCLVVWCLPFTEQSKVKALAHAKRICSIRDRATFSAVFAGPVQEAKV